MRPTMFGYILHYSVQTGTGVISGDDGNRYSFAGRDWLDREPPTRGDRVEFTALQDQAANITVITPAYRETPGPSHPSAVPEIASGCGAGCLTWIGVAALLGIVVGIWPGNPILEAARIIIAVVVAAVVGYLVFRAVRKHRRR